MNYMDYVEEGFRLVPLHSITSGQCGCGKTDCPMTGKHPRYKGWQEANYTDEQIEKMEENGDFKTGFGVVCDNVIVIDIDPRNGGDKSYARLVKDTGIDYKALSGFVIRTGGGGYHIGFAMNEATDLLSKLKGYEGIDFKSSGFVVGAGSLHKSGLMYEAEKGIPAHLTLPPQKLIELLKRPTVELNPISNGGIGDNEKLQRVLVYLNPNCEYDEWIRIGMGIHFVYDGSEEGRAVWDAWSQGSPKYDGPPSIAKHWLSFGNCLSPIMMGTLCKMAQENGYEEPVIYENIYRDDGIDPTSNLYVGDIDTEKCTGLLGEVIDFINSNSRFPRKKLAVAAALSTIGNIGGLRWRDESGGTSNMYNFCVAGSATGKDNVQKTQQRLQIAAGFSSYLCSKIKSEQEISDNIINNGGSHYSIDEVGSFFGKIVNSAGNVVYLEGIIPELLSAYSKTNGVWGLTNSKKISAIKHFNTLIKEDKEKQNKVGDAKKKAYEAVIKDYKNVIKDINNNAGISNPFVSMIGYTTPATFYDLLTYDQAANGFIGRTLITEENDVNPSIDESYAERPISSGLKDRLKKLSTAQSKLKKYDVFEFTNRRLSHSGEHEYVTTSDDAKSLLREISRYYHDRADHEISNSGLEAIVRRAYELVIKISMIAAMGEGGRRTVFHVKWAFALVQKDLEVKLTIVGANMARENDNRYLEAYLKVKHAMSKTVGVTAEGIIFRYQKLDSSMIKKCISDMEKRGVIRRVYEVQNFLKIERVKWYLI